MKSVTTRLLYVIIGSLTMGLGVAIAVKGGQGADPLAVFWEGLSNILPITIGQANILLSVVMLILALFMDKTQINIGTILNPIVLGVSTDLFIKLFNTPHSFCVQLIQSTIGVSIIGIGIGIYTSVNLGKGSYDAIVFSIVKKYNLNLALVRSVGDGIFLLSGFLLGARVGFSTIISVLFLGKIIVLVNKRVSYLQE
ncbi:MULTISPECIES: YczE/YyaS/YitT family protein [Clostridium]|uniref:Uncharacterized BCR, YitT family COG1284 n=1 Tax=Clostridium carnis TaxID=1530 RepID=A0ABY6SWZ0_9CLOT|nr:YitT family protein [Clostridium carnis]CAI3547600.1 Uncharacterized BCR, YitT family COG1284 [Clostridium neonatale]CAI3556530.1 Uncharacterized BCR, YitT family COG1284 [Clostridium neonatale]CAI3564505.1 Uncharacterized BCR, YitT family COG1284 [Clostridium neonatale]CAI3630606.1 Uncharacterized BCR, YitT family COG1284 [Clostridium neonatale]CAI3658924.1 Uncharacterized BCR, YitT family COG1284 [Clostridium neonatale]